MAHLQSVAGVDRTHHASIDRDAWKIKYLTPFLTSAGGSFKVPSITGSEIPVSSAVLLFRPSLGDHVASEQLIEFDVLGFMPANDWFDNDDARAVMYVGHFTQDPECNTWPHVSSASDTLSIAGKRGEHASVSARFFVDICLLRSILFQMSDPDVTNVKLVTLCIALHTAVLAMNSFMRVSPEYRSKVDELAILVDHPDVMQPFCAALIRADVHASHTPIVTAIRRMVYRHVRSVKSARSKRAAPAVPLQLFDTKHERGLRVITVMGLIDLDFVWCGIGVAKDKPHQLTTHFDALTSTLRRVRTTGAASARRHGHRGQANGVHASVMNVSILRKMLGVTTLVQHLDTDEAKTSSATPATSTGAGAGSPNRKDGEDRFAAWASDVLSTAVPMNDLLAKYDIEDRGRLPKGVYHLRKDGHGETITDITCVDLDDGWKQMTPSRASGSGFVIRRPKSSKVMLRAVVRSCSVCGTRKVEGDTRGEHAGALVRVQMMRSKATIATTGVASHMNGAGCRVFQRDQHFTFKKSFCIEITSSSVVVKQRHGAMISSWTPPCSSAEDVAVFLQHMECEVKFVRFTRS